MNNYLAGNKCTMKRFFNVLGLIMILALSAFNMKAQTMTPLQFNDNLSSITDSLYARGQQWGVKFNEAYQAKDFKMLVPYRQQLSGFVDKNIARVKVMKDVKNSKALRMAMIGFLEFEKKMITEGFMPLEQLSPSTSKEDVSAALEKLKSLSASENDQLKKVAIEQEAYAKANGFQIEAAKPDEAPAETSGVK